MSDLDDTRQRIFLAKAEQRKIWAKEPFESKLRELMRLQRINLEVKKAVGRKADRPWDMSEEQYLKEVAD